MNADPQDGRFQLGSLKAHRAVCCFEGCCFVDTLRGLGALLPDCLEFNVCRVGGLDLELS